MNYNLFSREETNALLNLAGNFYQAAVYSGNQAEINKRIRNSTKYDFQDNTFLKKIILPKVKDLGVIDIGHEAMILKYDEGHFFKRHIDRTSPDGKRRKNLIIQLSDEDEYEGGELIVDQTTVSKKLGTTVLFDCSTYHEVKLLKSGTRFCFLAHLQKSDLLQESKLI